MNTQQMFRLGAMVVLAGSLGGGVSYGADDQQSSEKSNQPSAFGRSGNQGEGFTEDQTIKGKGRSPESSPRQDAQINVGGARPVVEGEILKAQGDDYIIKDKSGSEVRLRVNKDTNMDCAKRADQGGTISTGRQGNEQQEIPPTSHMQDQMSRGQQSSRQSGTQQGQMDVAQSRQDSSRQPSSDTTNDRIGDQSGTQSRSSMGKDSGGDVARGSGFTVGQKGRCSFNTGDKVKAEVTDLGTVTYIRYLSETDMGSQQRSSGQMLQPAGQTKGEQQSAQQREQMLKPGGGAGSQEEQQTER